MGVYEVVFLYLKVHVQEKLGRPESQELLKRGVELYRTKAEAGVLCLQNL